MLNKLGVVFGLDGSFGTVGVSEGVALTSSLV